MSALVGLAWRADQWTNETTFISRSEISEDATKVCVQARSESRQARTSLLAPIAARSVWRGVGVCVGALRCGALLRLRLLKVSEVRGLVQVRRNVRASFRRSPEAEATMADADDFPDERAMYGAVPERRYMRWNGRATGMVIIQRIAGVGGWLVGLPGQLGSDEADYVADDRCENACYDGEIGTLVIEGIKHLVTGLPHDPLKLIPALRDDEEIPRFDNDDLILPGPEEMLQLAETVAVTGFNTAVPQRGDDAGGNAGDTGGGDSRGRRR